MNRSIKAKPDEFTARRISIASTWSAEYNQYCTYVLFFCQMFFQRTS